MLKINQNLVPREVLQTFKFSVVKKEKWSVILSWCIAITIVFCIFGFEAVASGLDDISKNRLKCSDVPGISLLFKYITTL